MDFLRETLTRAANEQGFVLVGFAPLRPLDEREEFYRRWLAGGGHASMTYLAKDPELRFDPRRLDPRYKSIVSLGYPYTRARDAQPSIGVARCAAESQRTPSAATITTSSTPRRARSPTSLRHLRPGPDHPHLRRHRTGVRARMGVAGAIGWFGKNTNLLNRDHGSYFFLAEIFTDLEFEATPEPYRDHCGTCRRCLDLCPTGALADGYVMRSELCISYLTIEHRGAIPRELRAETRQLDLRLRHLQGGLSVE